MSLIKDPKLLARSATNPLTRVMEKQNMHMNIGQISLIKETFVGAAKKERTPVPNAPWHPVTRLASPLSRAFSRSARGPTPNQNETPCKQKKTLSAEAAYLPQIRTKPLCGWGWAILSRSSVCAIDGEHNRSDNWIPRSTTSWPL